MDSTTGSALLHARRRTDALPDDDRAFIKGAGMAIFIGTCCWAVLLVLL